MPYQLTQAQIELQAARKAAKAAKAAASNGAVVQSLSPQELEKRRFLKREWIDVGEGESSSAGRRHAKIISWNLLAQTLVRRELFPGSDCLRWGDRKPILLAELEHYASADVLCFQECDRLKDLLTSLPNHSHVTASGPGKLHGLVILFRSARYRLKASKTVYLDDEEISPKGETDFDDPVEQRRRRGGTRQTKNIGLIAALEDTEHEGSGLVIATTHLFWHPKFAYERTRQALLLLRAVLGFRDQQDCNDWPGILAGDLNTQPDESTYQLLADPQRPLASELAELITASRFIHTSVDKIGAQPSAGASTATSNAGTGTNTPTTQGKDEEGDEEELPDTDERSIKGTRPCVPSDGLPSSHELQRLAQSLLRERGCRSAYDQVTWKGDKGISYTDRKGFERTFETAVPEGLKGHNEPAYTCYTPLFKLTLDYVFLLPSPSPARITHILRPGTPEELGEGLPRKGISASDHQAVGCGITW